MTSAHSATFIGPPEPPKKLLAFRFCLRLKPDQERQLHRISTSLRWLWNKALGEQQRRHKEGEKYASYEDMASWLTSWRNCEQTRWLSESPSHPQQQVLKRLDAAFKRFFKKEGGYPSFKKYGDNPGIRFPDPKQLELDQTQHKHGNGRLKVPKLGWLRLRQSRKLEDGCKIKNASIVREGKKWFVSLQVEQFISLAPIQSAPTLGVDLGLTAFAATSDGRLFAPLKALAKKQCRLKRYQRSVARKCKGSNNRKKAVLKLAKLHRKIAQERANWLHQLSTSIVRENPVLAIEDLQVKNMSASAAGTIEAPGRKVKQKSGLNRGILDAAWAEFARQLAYKTQWAGGQALRVPAAYSSQECRICGHTHADNRKSQSLFSCVACGHNENADLNAAQNILARGINIWESALLELTHEKSNSAAGRVVTVCGGAVRRGKCESASPAAPAKQKPTEEHSLV